MSLPQAPADIRIGGGRRTVMGLAGALAFVVFGLAMMFSPNAGLVQELVGAAEIVIFGPLPLYSAIRLHRVGCIYSFAADGIRFPMYEWPTIPWSDIQGAHVVARRGRRYLAIYVQDAELRVRHLKRGARMARWSLRNGLGLIAIPEQMAPTSLEALQAEVVRRTTGGSSVTPLSPPPGSAPTILPDSVARGAVPAGSLRSLRVVAGMHGAMLLMSTPAGHHSAAHRALAVALGGALVVGAWLLAPKRWVGLGIVVTAEAALMVVDLTAGHHIATATRVLYLFFPVCVLLVAAQAWPRQRP